MNATAPDINTVLYGIKADSYFISRTPYGKVMAQPSRYGFPVREIFEPRDAFTVREMNSPSPDAQKKTSPTNPDITDS